MSIAKEKLVIVDGNAVIYRSFYAVRSDLSSNGQPTNAVYGFFSILFKVINELAPQYLAVALDRPEPTFRHQLSAEYKAQRIKQPDELYSQIPIIKQLLAVMGIPVLEKAGYEADDIIGTVVRGVPGGIDSYIVTGDKDSFQLVDDQTRVYWLQQGLQKTIILDPEGVRRVIGLDPEQIVDYKALRGDPSDNIPGVPGIGDKTAVELLLSFGSLDSLQSALVADVDDSRIKLRWRRLINEHRASLDLSQQLARIDCAVPIDFSLASAKFENFDVEAIRQAFLAWQLRSLLPRLDKIIIRPTTKKIVSDVHQVLDGLIRVTGVDESARLASDWPEADMAIQPILENGRVVELIFICQNKALKLAIGGPTQQDLFRPNNDTGQGLLDPWRIILENRQTKKIIFQAKEVIKTLLGYGIKLEGLAGDLLLANYLLNPGARQDDLLSVGEQAGWSSVEAGQLLDLHETLVKQLADSQLLKIYYQVELPLVGVLSEMELSGIKVDQKVLAKLASEWQTKLAGLAERIYQQAGEEFNINSPKQLQVILFDKLGLDKKGLGKTKSGPSTDAANLQKLRSRHQIIDLLLEYRELTKLLNTYALALPRLVDNRDGRLHTTFQQAITATGRLSASEPNLQNIPTRTDSGKLLRQAFVAENGYQLISFDYSQIELRIMASLAGEESMIADFAAGRDIHSATAAKINNIPLDRVTNQQRRAAKAVNFGLLYGQGPRGLAESTGLSFGEAKDFIDQYFAVYPKLDQYMARAVDEARQAGFATTVWGRRRYLTDLDSPNPAIRRAAERMAINLPIQGTAADIMKAAMIKVDNWLKSNFTTKQARMILQIHDEILIEAQVDQVDKIVQQVPELMTGVIDLSVILAVSSDVGNNWSEL